MTDPKQSPDAVVVSEVVVTRAHRETAMRAMGCDKPATADYVENFLAHGSDPSIIFPITRAVAKALATIEHNARPRWTAVSSGDRPCEGAFCAVEFSDGSVGSAIAGAEWEDGFFMRRKYKDSTGRVMREDIALPGKVVRFFVIPPVPGAGDACSAPVSRVEGAAEAKPGSLRECKKCGAYYGSLLGCSSCPPVAEPPLPEPLASMPIDPFEVMRVAERPPLEEPEDEVEDQPPSPVAGEPMRCRGCGRAGCPMLRRGDTGPALTDCHDAQHEQQVVALESQLAAAQSEATESNRLAEYAREQYQRVLTEKRTAEAALEQANARVIELETQWTKHEEICSGWQEDPPNEVDRLNPYKRQWKDQPLPTEPLPLFLHGIRYYAGMLEDDDNWSHGLGHIEELCVEFDKAIHERAGKPYLPRGERLRADLQSWFDAAQAEKKRANEANARVVEVEAELERSKARAEDYKRTLETEKRGSESALTEANARANRLAAELETIRAAQGADETATEWVETVRRWSEDGGFDDQESGHQLFELFSEGLRDFADPSRSAESAPVAALPSLLPDVEETDEPAHNISAEHYAAIARDEDGDDGGPPVPVEGESRRQVQKVALRDPKSADNTCDCFKDCSRCGRGPAGWFMLEGWPDAVMCCAACEPGNHDHAVDARLDAALSQVEALKRSAAYLKESNEKLFLERDDAIAERQSKNEALAASNERAGRLESSTRLALLAEVQMLADTKKWIAAGEVSKEAAWGRAFQAAMAELRAKYGLQSPEQAVATVATESAIPGGCYCSDFMSGGVPCPPSVQCPNAPRPALPSSTVVPDGSTVENES